MKWGLEPTYDKAVLTRSSQILGSNKRSEAAFASIIILQEVLGSGSRREVADIFLKEAPDPDDFEKVREMMNQEGVFERTREIARQYSDTANAELAVFPKSDSRTSLEAMAKYVVYRQA